MKKLLIFTVLILTLGIAGGAAYHFLNSGGLSLRVNAAPPKQVPIGEVDYPEPATSTFAVKIDLPVSTLEQVANEKVPDDISGIEERDFHRMMRNGKIEYRIVPGSVALRNAGQNVIFSIPVRGVAKVAGLFDAQFVRFPIDSTANLGGSIHGTVTPRISRDWRFFPSLTPQLKLSQADVTLGRIGTISARDMIENAAEPMIRKQVSSLDQGIDLKVHIEDVWSKLHLNRQINEEPLLYAAVDPYAISMGPVDYSNPHNLSATIAIETLSHLSNLPPPDVTAEPLPDLEILSYNRPNQLQIPVIADLQSLNEMIATQSFEKQDDDGSSISVKDMEIRLGQEGRIILGCDITAASGLPGQKLSGKMWIVAKPELDVPSQKLKFSSIAFTEETRAAIPSSILTRLEPEITAALASDLQIDLQEYLPMIEAEAQKQISGAALPPGIDLIVGRPEIKLLRIYTVTRQAPDAETNPAVVVVVGLKGDITARVAQINPEV